MTATQDILVPQSSAHNAVGDEATLLGGRSHHSDNYLGYCTFDQHEALGATAVEGPNPIVEALATPGKLKNGTGLTELHSSRKKVLSTYVGHNTFVLENGIFPYLGTLPLHPTNTYLH